MTKQGLDPGLIVKEVQSSGTNFDITPQSLIEGDPVEFVLDDDLKVGDSIVVSKGAHALATVITAKKAGMMGRPGDLAVQIQYLVVGSNRVHIRGTKGQEGDSKTGAAVALTVLFDPIGLIKHGKNVEIPAGSLFTAYVDQDIWLALMNSCWHAGLRSFLLKHPHNRF